VSYRIARHSYDLTDEVITLKGTASIDWQDIDALPEGRGLVVLTPLIASKEISEGTLPKRITPDIVCVSDNNIQNVSL